MKAKAIMLLGTSSNVGKSVLATAFCRIFLQDGFRVAPFKAQNMALNSAATPDGKEIGRAQAVQAEAACVPATVDMNPVLIKPKQDMHAQIVVMGEPYADMSAKDYRNNFLPDAKKIVQASLDRLRAQFQIIVMEGAGSPAEINLKDRDIVNMKAAEMADAPVLLIADIDRGGVFAALVGTLELLEAHERARVKGFIINKFRGDIDLLKSGLDFLEDKTGVPVLGVIPYIHDHGIEEEDSVWLSEQKAQVSVNDKGDNVNGNSKEMLNIAIVQLPRISNFTDFMSLSRIPQANIRFVKKGEKIGEVDLLVIPGTKNTILDMLYLREQGYEQEIKQLAAAGKYIVGICGGYQMLGQKLLDPEHSEADINELNGLGLLECTTTFYKQKQTHQVKAEILADNGFCRILKGEKISGYEIHTGQTQLHSSANQLLCINIRSGEAVSVLDGAIDQAGKVFGTHLHGFFDNDLVLRSLIDKIRDEKGLAKLAEDSWKIDDKHNKYDRVAQTVREALDMKAIYRIIGEEYDDITNSRGSANN